MAMQMPYTDAMGNSYAASYWMVGSATVDQLNQVATLTVVGYRDSTSPAAGYQPINTLTFVIGPDQYATYFSEMILKTTPVYSMIYTALMAQPNAAMFASATQVA